jgi:hypothetical protein
MALVRKAISAKLDSDPSFHLEIHQDQLIHIKAVHPHVNDEGKKRLADFTVECSDPDFVLIMENLALKKVLNIMAVCNPTATLELKMDIGISKNQIGTQRTILPFYTFQLSVFNFKTRSNFFYF